MDLQTFVSSSLVEIAEGLRQANSELKDAAKNAGRTDVKLQHFSLMPHSAAADRTVEFDVAVTAAASGKLEAGGKARLFVVDVNSGASGELAHERVSRVRFRVHVEQRIY